VRLPQEQCVSDPNLLRILIEINQWEDCNLRELQTVSGRDLYFRIAATLLGDAAGKKQPLKLLGGRITDRATRNRIREFEALGLINVVDNEDDARTRRVIASDELIKRVNHHTQLFKQLCDKQYLMLDKS